MSLSKVRSREVVLGDRRVTYQCPWDGRPLTDVGVVAYDTETDGLSSAGGGRPPVLALASACAGDGRACLIHPTQVAAFVLAHPAATWVMHGAGFDFPVTAKHLGDRGERPALEAWWAALDANRMADTMTTDQLVQGAICDQGAAPRNLEVLAAEWAGIAIDKSDPYRLRYGELIGRDWDEVEEGFFAYAIADAIATYHVHRRLAHESVHLAVRHARYSPDYRPGADRRFGALTAQLQVRASVALAMIGYRGIGVDVALARQTEAAMRAEHLATIEAMRGLCPDFFATKTYKRTGVVKALTNPKTGLPCKSEKALQLELRRALGRLADPPDIPETTRGLSTSIPVWRERVDLAADPFLDAWGKYEQCVKLLQFFAPLQADTVRPRYQTLVRTGRTSCSRPNLQQMPRDARFRSMFIPRPGYLLMVSDFATIELRTLAAVCRRRYGRSRLGDVIAKGLDPHSFTAAMLLGVPFDEFAAWKEDPAKAGAFKAARQRAKPVNFGVPGGLGTRSLMAYARNSYGVVMGVEEASEMRRKLVEEVYPELSQYLAEDGMQLLAEGLRAPLSAVWDAFDPGRERSPATPGGVRKVVAGKTLNAKGKPYSPAYLDRVWTLLARLCQDPTLTPLLAAREAGPALVARLFGARAVTLTGRVRKGVTYTAARNTPFQALASDGAKEGLWRLLRAGFRTVGFVHDEVLIELKDRGGYAALAEVEEVERILVEAMAEVVGEEVPIAVESSVGTRWSKDATRRVDGDRVLAWSPGG